MPGSFSAVIERVSPAVASIHVSHSRNIAAAPQGERMTPGGPEGMEDFLKRFFGEDWAKRFGDRQNDREFRWSPSPRQPAQGAGSGFIIDEDGYVVTNEHVIRGASKITVGLKGGKKYTAKLVGSDSLTDIAVLKIEAKEDLPFVKFSKEDTPDVGDWVVTIGNPFGLGHTVTAGIVSAHHRNIGHGPYDDFIQIDAPINKGNSGGPAFNTKGEVIGVNTAIFSPTGGSVGIGFAIPAATVENVVAKLKDDGRVERGWLGVQIQGVTDDMADSLGFDKAKGAIVSKVLADGPAKDSDLKQGDVIVKVNGEAVDSARALPRLIADIKPGKAAQLEVIRDGKEKSVTVKLASRPDTNKVAAAPAKAEKSTMGMKLSSLDAGARQRFGLADDAKGVLITGVEPNSHAAEKGLSAGDLIVKVGNKQVKSPADVEESFTKAKDGSKKAVLMLVSRDKQQRFVAIPLRQA
ncbi:MAG: Do family serine endopeptidase [Alphaproteobacteria bacterium]|nr:Do family serine endopeptidase [Alphaproteobacteria bacterium]